MSIGDLMQTADWKTEKHVPVIECQDTVSQDEFIDLKVSLGKEVAHPNTTAHHIRWIRIFFKPENARSAYEIGSFEFSAHGEAVQGPDSGPVYTNHSVTCSINISVPGQIIAMAYCNIHGLWENSINISVR
jgi:superoxide reductase